MDSFVALEIDQAHLMVLLLAFARVGGLLQTLPLFSMRGVPIPVKVMLALITAVLLMPSLDVDPALGTASAARIGLAFASEALLGMAMGFSVAVLLTVLDIAGTFIGMNAGLAIAMQFDPMSEGQSLVVTRVLQIAGFLTFLGLNLHHEVLLGLADSFVAAAPGHGVLALTAGPSMAAMLGDCFVSALRVSMPVVATALFVNMVAALVTRFAQQMNIYFSVGLAAQSPLGLLAAALSLPAIVGVVVAMSGDLRGIVASFAG